jgi:hypothetical protein
MSYNVMAHHQQYNEKSPPNIMRLFKALLFVKQHEIENIVANQCCESIKKTLRICEITHVGTTSLPTKVYEITTNHIVRGRANIINGYENFVKAPPPTLCIARNFERANTIKLHDSSPMKHHENLAHESIGVPPIL